MKGGGGLRITERTVKRQGGSLGVYHADNINTMPPEAWL